MLYAVCSCGYWSYHPTQAHKESYFTRHCPFNIYAECGLVVCYEKNCEMDFQLKDDGIELVLFPNLITRSVLNLRAKFRRYSQKTISVYSVNETSSTSFEHNRTEATQTCSLLWVS